MNLHFLYIVVFIFLATISTVEASPRLAFSDLTNGPDAGIDDGLGSGAIVTIWGYELGDVPGEVFFVDSTGSKKTAAHIYYWKKANGKLPGGPANLYKSHRLYEVAFSLPKSAVGDGEIFIKNADGDLSDSLPFKITEGRIFHIKNSGSNLNKGTFNSPWQFMNADDSSVKSPGNGALKAGDIVYFHGTTEALDVKRSPKGRAAIFVRNLLGAADSHISFVSYPNTITTVESPSWGIRPYQSTGILISKFRVLGGILHESDGRAIQDLKKGVWTVQIRTSPNGRIIANHISDSPGYCSDGQAGAISGNGNDTDNVSIIGNEIADIGCQFTSHFHHTTYISRRTQTGAQATKPGIFAWNYLHDNKAKYGVHYYDQANDSSKPCDPLKGVLNIHDNYIENERSVAISVRTTGSAGCWEVDTNIFNNVLINVGLGPVAELVNGTQPYAMYLGGAISGKFNIFNNFINGISDASSRLYGTPFVIRFKRQNESSSLLFSNNIVKSDYTMGLIEEKHGTDVQNNVLKISSEETSIIKKLFDYRPDFNAENNYIADPQVVVSDHFCLAPSSPALGRGTLNRLIPYYFYGIDIVRKSPNIGPLDLCHEER